MIPFAGLRGVMNRTLVGLLNRLPAGTRLAVRQGVELRRKLDHPTHRVELIIDTPIELHTRVGSCRKEPETVAWLERVLRPGDVFYDVGANVGAYALLAARIAPGTCVFAFEPGYANYSKLCSNIVINELSKHVTAVPVAFAAATGLESFWFSSVVAGAASHVLGADGFDDSLPSQQVICLSLDDWLERFGTKPPTCLKIDVDGGEVGVITGGRRAFANPAVRTLLVEVSPATESKVTELLKSSGFSLAERHPHSELVVNCVFDRTY